MSIKHSPQLSIIICAKNEAENLSKNLPLWLNLTDISYEVILINDNSTDSSEEIISKFSTSHPHLNTFKTSDKYNHLKGKRAAIATALESVSASTIYFTDADCIPSKASIFSQLPFSQNSKVIFSGPSPYIVNRNLASVMHYFEQLQWQLLQKFTWKIQFPNTVTGRNWGGSTSLFTLEKLEQSNISLSGDDDLLFQAIKQEQPKFVYYTSLKTYSNSLTHLHQLLNQKMRHLQTVDAYSRIDKIGFLFMHINSLVISVLFIGCLINTLNTYSPYPLSIYCLSIIFIYLFKLIYLNEIKNSWKLIGIASFGSILVTILNIIILINRTLLYGKSNSANSRMESGYRNGREAEKWG